MEPPALSLLLMLLLIVQPTTGASAVSNRAEEDERLWSLTKEQLIQRVQRLKEQQTVDSCLNGRCPPWPEVMKTPPMMWNGWLPSTRHLIPGFVCSPSDPFGCNNESLYYAAADRLVSSGLRDLGYDTIGVTCHGWQRDPVTKKLRANPITWPRGYKGPCSLQQESMQTNAACAVATQTRCGERTRTP